MSANSKMLHIHRPMKIDFLHSVYRTLDKEALALSTFIEKTAHFIFSFTNFRTQKYFMKSLFNYLNIALEQCYFVVFTIRFCVL